ncbi:hypothetical protein L798_10628 [Zootermopsis nevadensis]|uniref:Uncharacterized protein n=1 Tax=Zootermopsis nevadensis TaxID=136037 RepID=A0A067R052_ZOONE|nr:hypothetical protein L798_10628 [Zootermopsis nevadensis]
MDYGGDGSDDDKNKNYALCTQNSSSIPKIIHKQQSDSCSICNCFTITNVKCEQSRSKINVIPKRDYESMFQSCIKFHQNQTQEMKQTLRRTSYEIENVHNTHTPTRYLTVC